MVYNNYSTNSNLQKLDSLLQTKILGKISSIKYVTSGDFTKQIKNEFIEKQNYYSIDVISSPAIEFLIPKNIISGSVIHSGRMYYVYSYYNSQNLLVPKSDAFLTLASDFFKWVKKNFKNVKLSGYDSYLISQRTEVWMRTTGGKLSEMIREEEFRKKKLTVFCSKKSMFLYRLYLQCHTYNERLIWFIH